VAARRAGAHHCDASEAAMSRPERLTSSRPGSTAELGAAIGMQLITNYLRTTDFARCIAPERSVKGWRA